MSDAPPTLILFSPPLVALMLPSVSPRCILYSTPSTHLQDGLLFLGSRVGNSQVLALPPGTLSGVEESAGSGRVGVEASAGSGGAGGGGQQAGTPLRWRLASPALIKSLAPVHDCVEVPDANGEGPPRGLLPTWCTSDAWQFKRREPLLWLSLGPLEAQNNASSPFRVSLPPHFFRCLPSAGAEMPLCLLQPYPPPPYCLCRCR